MSIHTPYTYLVGWSKTNKFYYGVRYAKNCNPSDLFITYFTSSKHVKNYTKKHGNPDIIEIRKVFGTIQDAMNWENKVLRRMNVKEDARFLNATHNIAIPPSNFDRSKNFDNWLKLPYEKRLSLESRQKISEASRKNITKLHKEGKITYSKPDDKHNYKTAAKKRWSDPKFKLKAKSRKHINNGQQSKMVLPEDIQYYLNNGWKLGRLSK
jgi:hypothetical protein